MTLARHAHKPFNLFRHAQALPSHHSHPGCRNERQSLYWRSKRNLPRTSVAADLPGRRSPPGAQNTGIRGLLPVGWPDPASLQCRPANNRLEGYRDSNPRSPQDSRRFRNSPFRLCGISRSVGETRLVLREGPAVRISSLHRRVRSINSVSLSLLNVRGVLVVAEGEPAAANRGARYRRSSGRSTLREEVLAEGMSRLINPRPLGVSAAVAWRLR
jgi:hypothetical protein